MKKHLKTTSPTINKKSIGDLLEGALKIADERYQIQVKIKEALLEDDDVALKVHARELVGLPAEGTK